uniref:Sugar transporter SWEET n=1 Tax=Acrobeloides nanus TaxID=290746 RepID=A0A914CRW6_9BILA
MGVLGGVCWFSYGYLKSEKTVLYVTSVQVTLYSSYLIFYWIMTKEKLWISVKILTLICIGTIIGSMAYFFQQHVYHPLGILLWDFYLIIPNGVGFLLATGQLLLFVVLPRKPGQRSPYAIMLEPVKLLHNNLMKENELLDVDLYIVEKGFPREVRKSVDANNAYKQLIHSYFYFTDSSTMGLSFTNENIKETEMKPLLDSKETSLQSSTEIEISIPETSDCTTTEKTQHLEDEADISHSL